MMRLCATLLLTATLALLSFGCDKKPQKPQTEQPAETGTEQPVTDEEQPGKEEPGETAPQADAGADGEADTGETAECPQPRQAQGMCAQVITWAKNPDTGACCQYATPCEAPQNWQTFNNEQNCQQAGGQTP
ncbi:hypothetical protein FIV42_06400 [Persicimonas caeni]|uniref:Uncharacterized protein n=1 Tax=Persicimonas caeni TaxID=2292766 RepID=A0A4Y6PPW9_PERCE|nr:hypothetical protein [Persicimonas caeni]QDG50376.1 hypothetical protein FIV42_06400 [Persicimonas caeni]QED31597.1 hypothetical protein FRD00_06395 [Persicimonas caeni]